MPLTRVPPGRLRRIAVPALVVYLLAWIPFFVVGEPDEMVRLQRAGSETNARKIVAEWSPSDTVDMAFLQGVDAVHLLTYGPLLAVGAVWAGRRLRGRLAGWAPVVAWMAISASAFDALENVGMIVMIRGDVDAPVPAVTTVFATAKFSMFLVVVPYIVAGVMALTRRETMAADPT